MNKFCCDDRNTVFKKYECSCLSSWSKKELVWIAYPWRLFDRKWNVQNILTYIAGNIFGMKEVKALKLLDVRFPPAMMEQYDGPSYTLQDMRNYLWVYDRPILGTIVKPKMWLTSAEYAEVCYDFWVWWWDFVKNDEPQADQDFSPYDKMVRNVKEAMDKAVKETGKKKVHSFNVSAADFDTMIERCEMIVNSGMEPGSYAFWLMELQQDGQQFKLLEEDIQMYLFIFIELGMVLLLGQKILLVFPY